MSIRVETIEGMKSIQCTIFTSRIAASVFVASLDDYFRVVPHGTLTLTTGLVYRSNDGLAQFVRLLIPSRKWLDQATWYIDEANATGLASDENTGADATHPLRTGDEFERRLGRRPTQDKTVNLYT